MREQREILLRRVALKCGDFARQLTYHRALIKYKNSSLFFWKTMLNNTIDLAVLDWMHLFGSHNDDLHWKRVLSDNKDNFKHGLLQHLQVNEHDWELYREKIKKYRDEDVAHIEAHLETDVPEMEEALKAVSYYYQIILRKLRSEYPNCPEYFNRWPDDLLKYYEDSLKQSEEIVQVAYESTKNMKESVH